MAWTPSSPLAVADSAPFERYPISRSYKKWRSAAYALRHQCSSSMSCSKYQQHAAGLWRSLTVGLADRWKRRLPFTVEKTALQELNPSNTQLPGKPYSEDIDSFAYLPAVEGIGGCCTSGLQPLYRTFCGPVRFPDDANHRFTTDIGFYNALVGLGWDGEGVKACLPR